MSDNGKLGLSRFTADVAVALLTGLFGVTVSYGALESGIGWTEMGPDAGYFPFYIGLLIVFGSVMNLLATIVKRKGKNEPFIEGAGLKTVLGFLLPIIAFAAISTLLGLYVGTALYLAGVMTFQGSYKWWQAAAVGVAVALAFFGIFEIGFRVPLLKGPVEAFFGIY